MLPLLRAENPKGMNTITELNAHWKEQLSRRMDELRQSPPDGIEAQVGLAHLDISLLGSNFTRLLEILAEKEASANPTPP